MQSGRDRGRKNEPSKTQHGAEQDGKSESWIYSIDSCSGIRQVRVRESAKKNLSNCADFCDSNYKDNPAKMMSRFIVQKWSAYAPLAVAGKL